MSIPSSNPQALRVPLKWTAILVLALGPSMGTSEIVASGENWPAWRGADGSGTYPNQDLPLHWGPNQNVRWHVPLPERGNSTPVIWNERVFVTQAIENRRTLMCFDRRDGRLLWQMGPTWTEKELTHPDNPHCAASPVTDGQRVIAWFGSAGVYCYDFAGRELWRRDLGRQSHDWGYGSSPVLYEELCILNFGPGRQSFLIALDKQSGKTVWRYDLPPMADVKWEDVGGDARNSGAAGSTGVADVAGSWATPLIVRSSGPDELVVAVALRLMAFQPKTGELLWTCDGPNIGAYSSPFLGSGIIGLNASGLRNTIIAVSPGGRGNVTATHRRWIQYPGKACIGAGVIYQGHIYQVNTMGIAECRDLGAGKIVWEKRLTSTGARNASWSSPVLAGDRLYVANQNADVFILRASPKYERIATNSIGGEPMNASLAVSRGDIFIRTDKQLWCIGATR